MFELRGVVHDYLFFLKIKNCCSKNIRKKQEILIAECLLL